MFQRESGEDNPVPEGSMFKRPSWSREFPGEIYGDRGHLLLFPDICCIMHIRKRSVEVPLLTVPEI